MSTGARQTLQQEIAALAARYMAEDGADCAAAVRKAARQMIGDAVRSRDGLPDNAQVEVALRSYLRSEIGAPYRQWLRGLRELAVQWMQELAPFEPRLVGAVLNGSATRHSHLHLHLYTDSAKDVEIALLERGLDIRVDEAGAAHAQETIGFVIGRRAPGGVGDATGVLLTVYEPLALRTAPAVRPRAADPQQHSIERAGRADLAMVRRLLEETGAQSATAAGHG